MLAFRRLAVFAAAAALVSPQVAAAQAPCLTEAEVSSLVGYALPSALNGVIERCRPTLPARSWFATDGAALVTRYAARKPAAWPGAKSAFLKLASDKDSKGTDLLAGLPDSALQPFAEAMVSEMVAKEVKADQCAGIERAVRLLAPLPPENTAELAAFIIGLTNKPGADKGNTAKKPGLPICRTGA